MMIQYDHSFDHDALLLTWYQELLRTGDLATTFMPRAQSLSGWFGVFAKPTELLFVADEHGIWWAGWFEPGYGGLFFGLWVRRDKRRSSASLDLTMTALHSALAVYPAVLGITKQEALLDPHRHLGYTIMEPPIPGLWGEQSAWLVVLTKGAFEKGRSYGRWRRRQTAKLSGDRQAEHTC